jgi:hypothetical protein
VRTTVARQTPQRVTNTSSHATPARDKKYNSQQAVAERVCDEKSGERRGDQLKITTPPGACFRKIFAAQIPPSPQSDQGRAELFEPALQTTKPEATSSNAQNP